MNDQDQRQDEQTWDRTLSGLTYVDSTEYRTGFTMITPAGRVRLSVLSRHGRDLHPLHGVTVADVEQALTVLAESELLALKVARPGEPVRVVVEVTPELQPVVTLQWMGVAPDDAIAVTVRTRYQVWHRTLDGWPTRRIIRELVSGMTGFNAGGADLRLADPLPE